MQVSIHSKCNNYKIVENYLWWINMIFLDENKTHVNYVMSACRGDLRFSCLNFAHFSCFHVLLVGYTLTYRRGCSCLRKYEGCAVIDSLQSQWVSERVVPTHSIPRRVRLLCATHAACYYNYSNESRLQLFRAKIAHTRFLP